MTENQQSIPEESICETAKYEEQSERARINTYMKKHDDWNLCSKKYLSLPGAWKWIIKEDKHWMQELEDVLRNQVGPLNAYWPYTSKLFQIAFRKSFGDHVMISWYMLFNAYKAFQNTCTDILLVQENILKHLLQLQNMLDLYMDIKSRHTFKKSSLYINKQLWESLMPIPYEEMIKELTGGEEANEILSSIPIQLSGENEEDFIKLLEINTIAGMPDKNDLYYRERKWLADIWKYIRQLVFHCRKLTNNSVFSYLCLSECILILIMHKDKMSAIQFFKCIIILHYAQIYLGVKDRGGLANCGPILVSTFAVIVEAELAGAFGDLPICQDPFRRLLDVLSSTGDIQGYFVARRSLQKHRLDMCCGIMCRCCNKKYIQFEEYKQHLWLRKMIDQNKKKLDLKTPMHKCIVSDVKGQHKFIGNSGRKLIAYISALGYEDIKLASMFMKYVGKRINNCEIDIIVVDTIILDSNTLYELRSNIVASEWFSVGESAILCRQANRVFMLNRDSHTMISQNEISRIYDITGLQHGNKFSRKTMSMMFKELMQPPKTDIQDVIEYLANKSWTSLDEMQRYCPAETQDISLSEAILVHRQWYQKMLMLGYNPDCRKVGECWKPKCLINTNGIKLFSENYPIIDIGPCGLVTRVRLVAINELENYMPIEIANYLAHFANIFHATHIGITDAVSAYVISWLVAAVHNTTIRPHFRKINVTLIANTIFMCSAINEVEIEIGGSTLKNLSL